MHKSSAVLTGAPIVLIVLARWDGRSLVIVALGAIGLMVMLSRMKSDLRDLIIPTSLRMKSF